MKQSIQDFENQLILGLEPVTVRNYGLTAIVAGLAASFYTFLCIYLVGSKIDLATVQHNIPFVLGFICLLAAAAVLVAGTISTGFPGRTKSVSRILIVSVLLFALANGLYLYSGAFLEAVHDHPEFQPGLKEIIVCARMVFFFAIFPSLGVMFSLRKLAPLNKTKSALLASGFALSSGSLVMMSHCPLNDVTHRLFGHFLSFIVIVPLLMVVMSVANKVFQSKDI